MRFIQILRSLLTLLILPLLTFITSLVALIQGGIFRVPAKKLQWIPRIMWGRVIAGINRVKVEVRGFEKLDQARSYIFAANHQSMFDIFCIQGYFDFDFRWMAKKELFKIPVFGLGMRLAGYIPVDRSVGRRAVKSLEEAAGIIAAGTSVVIFPEGTRSPDGKLKPFKAGGMVLAIKSGVPLVPIAIVGTYEVLPKGKFLARPGHVVISIGEPIDTGEYNLKEKHELAERLHDAVAALQEEVGKRSVEGEA